MHFTKKDIEQLERIKRLNLINSIAGIRPANLIGTTNGQNSNLAIFSSVMHLGSSPALLGFIVRPEADVKRNTFENIKSNACFSINHVPLQKISNAHATSAKFSEVDSEFIHCDFKEQWIDGFGAPFVQESHLKIGLTYLQSIPIEVNNTTLVIGQVEHIIINDQYISQEGYIDLESTQSAGVSGLNSYYQLRKIATFPYARIFQ
jgi:flavin reductase (DIM6/NTAB) family NADH-FMN oxidoreductase RutF